MQSLTSRSSTRRRLMRLAGTGATALLAATAIASAAGAATAATPHTGATGSVASLSASSMEVQSTTSGQTTVNWTHDHDLLQDSDRGGEPAGQR